MPDAHSHPFNHTIGDAECIRGACASQLKQEMRASIEKLTGALGLGAVYRKRLGTIWDQQQIGVCRLHRTGIRHRGNPWAHTGPSQHKQAGRLQSVPEPTYLASCLLFGGTL